MCVNDLSKVALDNAAAGIEPATSSHKSNAVTSEPPRNVVSARFGSFLTMGTAWPCPQRSLPWEEPQPNLKIMTQSRKYPILRHVYDIERCRLERFGNHIHSKRHFDWWNSHKMLKTRNVKNDLLACRLTEVFFRRINLLANQSN